MAVQKGVMSYSRFLVKCESALSHSEVAEKLNLFKFRPLHESGADNEALGWCPYLNEYDHERPIEVRDFCYDDKVVLSMRWDSITLPKALLQAMVKKSMSAYAKDHPQPLSRTVKKEIETAEALALRAKVLPRTKLIESIWCQKENQLRVFCRSASLLDRYLDLFQQTFLIRPQRQDHVFKAASMCALELEPLRDLQHVPMFAPTVRIDVQ